MRVALDTSGLYTTKAGIARYTKELLKGLRQVAPEDVSVSECAWPVENFAYRQPERWMKTFYREFCWGWFVAPASLRRRNIDILHSLASLIIRVPQGCRHVVTLHDLALIRHPERFRPWQRISGRRRLKEIAKADKIICISRFTANEAMELLEVDAQKIEVIYNGCPFQEQEPLETCPSFNVPADFFLFVGSLEPGKNLSLLKEAYQLAVERNVCLPPLVIVGARWEGTTREGKPPTNWHYLGRQPDEILVYLYRRARAFLFPSKYEGFGLPVLEAMTFGCPVICSPVASLPEVGGEAALMAEQDPASYLRGMRRLMDDEGLRRQLIEMGKMNVKRFSWTKAAEETIQIYRSILPG